MEVLQEMKERFWLKPVAFLLGVLAWFYVNIISTTPISREYKVKIYKTKGLHKKEAIMLSIYCAQRWLR